MTTSERPRATSWFPDVASPPPRTIDEALDRMPEATLAIVAAPRAVAAVEVRRALERGLDVLVAGEGLAPIDAAAEATFALDRGRLLLVDDAIIDGVALRGRLVAPRRGGVGVIAVDVGGAVEASAAIERAGYGASHVVVIGDDDVASEGHGAAARAAVARLGADRGTTAIAVVGRGDPRALRDLAHAAVATGKPAVLCGVDGESRRGVGWERIGALGELPRALARLGVEPVEDGPGVSTPGLVLGAISSATVAHEVLGALLAAGLDVASNVPRPGVLPEDVGGHTVRVVPDGEERATWVRAAAAAAWPQCVLVDLPATPASDAAAAPLLAALAALLADGRATRVVVARARLAASSRSAVDEALADLGATVVDGAALAARIALGARGPLAPPLAGRALGVVALGDESAASSLSARGVACVAVAWAPPAGGDARLARLVGLLR